ncbi:MAG TPA: IS1380 family transposase [Rubrobacter sp.]
MTDCATTGMRFGTQTNLALEATFDGGRITSDGGLVWLAEADSELGLCEAISEHVPEWRKRRGRHSLESLVRQRVFQIACGYEDQDDADFLREDPLLKLSCGSLPQSGAELASQPTLSRLENAATRRSCHRIAEALFELYLSERASGGAPPRKVLLDLDSTADPTHGDQEGSYYHGYYRQHIYHPLLVFDGESGHLICTLLRAGNTHGSNSAVALLKRIVSRLRGRWPEVEIEIRADAGFAVPALYDYCEAESITYTVGLITNARLEGMAEDLLAKAKERHEEIGEKARLFSEGPYGAASWERRRRVVYKAEAMEKGTNTRFVLTTRTDGPKDLYEFYARRGESENWIKDLKVHMKADRLSCHRFIANQFRLLLHAAAYWLMDALRRKLVRGGVRRMQLDSLRLRLIKIGGRVRELLTKVRLHLASGHPGQALWHALSGAFGAVHE